jgi:molybdopterin-binding protein
VINIKGLCLSLGDFHLRDVTLEINQGEYFIVLGPTGAGKTVLLEALAGLHPLERGEVWLHGEEVSTLPPEKRGLAIVYQDNALFPHLTVRDNILFGPKLRRTGRKDRDEALGWVANLMAIPYLLDRRPDTLSGGEQQKVALARALVTKPGVLLLDEPLSALDPETREEVQKELARLHKELGLTVVHVTHDFEEAIALGQRLAVLGEGQVKQVGTVEQVFRQPNSEFVARFALTRNIFAGAVTLQTNGELVFKAGEGQFIVAEGVPGPCHATIRPEDILISREPVRSSARNCHPGVITRIVNKGPTLYISVNLPPQLVCLVTRHSFDELELHEGQTVYATFKAAAVHIF